MFELKQTETFSEWFSKLRDAHAVTTITLRYENDYDRKIDHL